MREDMEKNETRDFDLNRMIEDLKNMKRVNPLDVKGMILNFEDFGEMPILVGINEKELKMCIEFIKYTRKINQVTLHRASPVECHQQTHRQSDNQLDLCYKKLPRKPRMLASGMNWQNKFKKHLTNSKYDSILYM